MTETEKRTGNKPCVEAKRLSDSMIISYGIEEALVIARLVAEKITAKKKYLDEKYGTALEAGKITRSGAAGAGHEDTKKN